MPSRVDHQAFRFGRPLLGSWRVSCIVRGLDAVREEGHLADWETYESPFIECLESARVRLKEGSYLQIYFGGWALPFPRTGCAPGAENSLVHARRGRQPQCS